jgi:glutathione peroxidase-family protein
VDGKECRVSNAASLYDIEDVDHRKQAVQMSKFKGKVLLIMNVAKK